MESQLRKEFEEELDGYARDYLEITGIVIPQQYLNEQLEIAVESTLNNTTEEAETDTWEPDCFRDILYETCTIHKDYPM